MRWLLVACLGMLVAGPAWACGPYRLAFLPYPGLHERSPQGQERGFDVDMVQAMAERSGCRFETQVASSARIWPALATGQIDIAVSALRTPEREELAEFLILARARPQLLLPRSLAQRHEQLAEFNADATLRVGVVRGGRYVPAISTWLEQLRHQGRLSEGSDKHAVLRAYEAGRVQAVLVYPMELHQRDATFHEQHVLRDWWPGEMGVGGWALSLSRVTEADRARLREAARSLQQDGSLLRMAERSMGPVLARSYVLP